MVLWVWISRRWRGWRSALHVVQPATVLAWHRRGFRLFWTWKSRHRTGRPAVPHDVRVLIREMSTTIGGRQAKAWAARAIRDRQLMPKGEDLQVQGRA